ncbi:hypothetical protein DFP72DRAFT_461505 [Ephemerocybe angulata]|uniref:Nephrocystin 3-like N-terminal domain-containing protein n=1 Tax=Ephemerocybe angulata TaxID=980116 RepID=A0A8H6HSK5_9AGAR|nr:hypothetical protein DFP72DRAFT_461505 [Tulosesus angulatus]
MTGPFDGAHHFKTGDNTFVTVGGNYIDNRTAPPPPAADGARQLLKPYIAAGSLHNSEDRCDAPKCHPETRVAVQDSIVAWASHDALVDDSNPAKDILWVTGPAGTGKTAIAGSVAETCSELGMLAGAFFFSSFSGDARRRLKRYLVPTLAYQLVPHECFQGASREVELAIGRDPAIFELRLKDQVEALILGPLRASRRSIAPFLSIPKVVIIDGLDECEAPPSEVDEPATGKHIRKRREAPRTNEDEQVEILEALLHMMNEPAFPFRIILFSRPDPSIRRFFSRPTTRTFPEIFLNGKYDPDSDVALFLRAKFAEIRLRHPALPTSWPSEDVIRLLVQSASGQFIYAATVIRSGYAPIRRKHPNPLAHLDMLYTSIMNRCPDPRLLATWITIIAKKVFADGYVTDTLGWKLLDVPRPAFFWRALLSSYPGEADALLENVSSLLAIPPRDDLKTKFHFYHRSFEEFLSSRQRCVDLYISEKTRTSLLIARCVHVLKARAPECALTEEEAVDFYNTFSVVVVQSSLLSGAMANLTPASKADLLACDLPWWMQTLCKVPGVSYQGITETSGCGLISGWLDDLHMQCNPLFCHPVCKHWRRGAECFARADGRYVPNRRWRISAAVIAIRRTIGDRRSVAHRVWPSGLAIPYEKIALDRREEPHVSL